ncbi:hypothetical protein ACJMK2_029879 [Sinanodonta woodiana]|uniref:Peptidase C14A caspase catalytic domain-containing protein n=1 Tax=Sinanodonta woodiana TaxID=1069815 RepID=A0ABD3XBK3_SINWO
MADETDSCLLRCKNNEQIHEHSSDSNDEPCGFDAKNLIENRSTSKQQRTNYSDRKIDVRLDTALGKKPDQREPIRGSALFVVNQTFQKHTKYRSGAEKVLIYLKSVFVDKLGFQQLNKGNDFNLSLDELDDVIAKAISKDYSNTDFFVFAISTHGEERPRGSDQFEHALLCADDQYKSTMDIFIIQACRTRSDSNKTGSKSFDDGHKFVVLSKAEARDSESKSIYNVQADDIVDANNKVYIKEEANTEEKANTKVNTEDEASDTVIPRINIPKDCLVVFAIQSGMSAARDRDDGSILLHYLNETMKKCTSQPQINFLDILTKTAFKMYVRETDIRKIVSVFHHRLTKDILIPQHCQT